MIGNDVVDLALARKESDWKRRGFLQKLFTENERQLILAAPDPETSVWNLWSRKEAAYKIYNRETGIRAFIPLQLECIFESDVVGKVKIGNRVYFTETAVSEEKIHTVAVAKKSDLTKVFTLENAAEISTIDGIPYIDRSKTVVSKSHHGRFEEIVALGYKPNLALSLRKSSAIV